MRTFISVELTDEVRKKIVELIEELKRAGAGVKWVADQNLHLTLKFLGWVEDRNIDKLTELTVKAAAKHRSFKISFAGSGTFPDLPAGRQGTKSPRVVWVGTAEGGDELCQLAKDLEEILSQAGFRSEEREFKPHLTIGRVKDKKNLAELVEKLQGIKNAKFGEMIVDRICVMKSKLTPKGPIYEIHKEVKL